MKKLIFTALLVASSPAFAAGSASAPKSFTRDGVTYTYTVSQDDGRTVIKGSDDEGKPFKLLVSGNRVSGNYANAKVGFTHETRLGGLANGGSK